MSDRYQAFTQSSRRPAARQEPRPAEPRPRWSGTPRARRWSTAPSSVGGTGRLAESLPGLLDDARHRVDRRPPTPAETYKGLVFDATGLTTTAELVALRDFFTPLLRSLETCPRVVVLGTPPEQVAGARAGRPARARGLHPQPRQGGRPGRHRPARVRRRRRRGRGRLDAGVPAVAEVGLRLRPGRPDRRHRHRRRRRRSRTGSARSTARSRWSPAPAAASASRSPGCCTATAPPSSASTCPRPPASCRR